MEQGRDNFIRFSRTSVRLKSVSSILRVIAFNDAQNVVQGDAIRSGLALEDELLGC